jgi:hypothetical protein
MESKKNPAAAEAGGHNVRVTLNFRDVQPGQALPPTAVYVFDRSGRLVSHHRYGKEPVTFRAAADARYQLRIGPDLIDGEKVSAGLSSQLDRANALTQDYIPQLHGNAVSIAINPNLYICWWKTCIDVHGTVRKLLNPGSSQPVYAPICAGTVQIFQVDLECTLDQIAPNYIIYLRDSLVSRITAQQVPHLINPGDPGPGSRLQANVRSRLGALRKTAATRTSFAAAKSSATSASVASASAMKASSLSEVAATLPLLSGATLKKYLIANFNLIYWLWCELIPDWAFCWQELTEVMIQSDGSFSAEICFWCPADFPDLYFEVVQNIGGVSTEVSDPQIACSTYYNYDGSQSVDIVVDDPNAIACLPGGPGPDYLYVWPNYIGWEDLYYVEGLTPATTGIGLLPGKTPFGGTLQVKMQMHPDLPVAGVSYFRWSYSFGGGFTPITNPFTIRYQTITYPTPTTILIVNTPVAFSEQSKGGNDHLFAIPGHLASNQAWIDFPYANFDSTLGGTAAAGQCTLKLEMFDNAGNPVPCNNVVPGGPFTFLLADQTQPTVGTYTNAPSANIDGAGNLLFTILVDNNHTVAQLPKVTTPISSTDSEPCGILHYTNGSDPVDIYYVASHPNNYLDWSLSVALGIKGQVAGIAGVPGVTDTSAGAPVPPGPAADFENSAASLLGTCTQGAFAVNLYCAARAVDGYSRQSQYDSSATIGFALLTP